MISPNCWAERRTCPRASISQWRRRASAWMSPCSIKYGYTIIDVAKEVQNAVVQRHREHQRPDGGVCQRPCAGRCLRPGWKEGPVKGEAPDACRVPARVCVCFSWKTRGAEGVPWAFCTLRGICSFLFMHGCCIIQSSMTKSRGIIPPWRNRNDQNCCPRDCRPLCL